jgi:hypothetical protein
MTVPSEATSEAVEAVESDDEQALNIAYAQVFVLLHALWAKARPAEHPPFGFPKVADAPELYECEACSAKPGSPSLCLRCLAARRLAGSTWVGPRGLASPAYSEAAWYDLQQQVGTLVRALRGRPDSPDVEVVYRQAHRVLHRLWTQAVGASQYDKRQWRQLEGCIDTVAHALRRKVKSSLFRRFGPATGTLDQRIIAWLKSEGLDVGGAPVARGTSLRDFVEAERADARFQALEEAEAQCEAICVEKEPYSAGAMMANRLRDAIRTLRQG